MQKKHLNIKYSILKFDELSSQHKSLVEEAKSQTQNSYSIYSNFSVGCAILLENGKIVGGNNQENAAFPSGLCAERVAMFYANSKYAASKPLAIAIAAKSNSCFLKQPISPCGACRQVLLESEVRYKNPIKTILYGEEHCYVIEKISDLLPFEFSETTLH